MHLSEIWHSKKNDCRLSRTQVNGFEYTNKEKIDKIKRNGLTVFCQFLEATGLQNVRIYLLSTIATLFFGIFIKLCLELLWRRFKIIIHKSNK